MRRTRAGSALGAPSIFGLGDLRFRPDMLPGCQLFACTDTSAYPGAVVFPADATVDGSFEVLNLPNWTAGGGAALTRVANPHPGSAGSYCMRVTNANGYAMPAAPNTAIANTYLVEGWARGDGTSKPTVVNSSLSAKWQGTTSTDWQRVSIEYAPNGTQEPILRTIGGTWTEWDDIVLTPKNASQLTDLTGLGHHLVQATAAKQPLFVASGAGGVLRTDGLARYMKGSWVQNRPTHVFFLTKFTKPAAVRYLIDGGTAQHAALYYDNAADKVYTFGGAVGPDYTPTDATTYLYDMVFDATNQKLGVNGGTLASGAGATVEPDGFTFGGWANGGLYTAQDVSAVIIYNRQLSEPERQKVVRWTNRLRGRLSL